MSKYGNLHYDKEHNQLIAEIPMKEAPEGGYRYERTCPLPEVVMSNNCKCIDCGGSEPTHSGDCTYMNDMFGDLYAPPPKTDYEVKSWPWFFQPMMDGEKKHDMRDKRDRPYKVGDRMLLREFDPRGSGYTGRTAVARITYITSNDSPCAMSSGALDNNYAILSVEIER
jgi:hypothetical protein